MYSHKEFLAGTKNGTLTFRVNPDAFHTETALRLPNNYRRSVSISKGISMLLLAAAFPLYLLFSWILAALSIAGGIAVYFYFNRLNYRVFVRAQVKENEEFFNQCQKNSAIIIMQTGKAPCKDKQKKIKVLVATHNPSKLKRYTEVLSDVRGVELVSLKDLKITDEAEEPYKTSAENAAFKAKFYGDISKLITVAVDEALTTNFLPPESQPGVLVRRIKKDRGVATDKELVAFWKETISLYDTENKKFIWDYSIAYYDPVSKKTGSTKIERIDSVAQNISTKILPGYPMGSFLVGPGLDKPFSELSATEANKSDAKYYGKLLDNFPNWLKTL